MKFKALALTAALGLAATVTYGQGVLIWNLANGTAGTGATSGGLVYTNNLAGNALGIFDGVNRNIGVEVFGGNGSAANSMGTFTPGTDTKGYTGADYGKFQISTASPLLVPGVAAGGIATIRLDMWYETAAGNAFASYAAALAGGGSVDSVTFENPTGSAAPPIPDQQLTGMPGVELRPVPEPSTMVLTGLGVGALWLLRRRK